MEKPNKQTNGQVKRLFTTPPNPGLSVYLKCIESHTTVQLRYLMQAAITGSSKTQNQYCLQHWNRQHTATEDCLENFFIWKFKDSGCEFIKLPRTLKDKKLWKTQRKCYVLVQQVIILTLSGNIVYKQKRLSKSSPSKCISAGVNFLGKWSLWIKAPSSGRKGIHRVARICFLEDCRLW